MRILIAKSKTPTGTGERYIHTEAYFGSQELFDTDGNIFQVQLFPVMMPTAHPLDPKSLVWSDMQPQAFSGNQAKILHAALNGKPIDENWYRPESELKLVN